METGKRTLDKWDYNPEYCLTQYKGEKMPAWLANEYKQSDRESEGWAGLGLAFFIFIGLPCMAIIGWLGLFLVIWILDLIGVIHLGR